MPPPVVPGPPCAQQIMQYYDVDGWNKWISVGALIGLSIAWRLLHWLILFVRFRKLRIKT